MKINIISKEKYNDYHNIFIDMWIWLSQHPECSQYDYTKTFNMNLESDCSACQLAEESWNGSSLPFRLWVKNISLQQCGLWSKCIFCPLKNQFGLEGCNPFYLKWNNILCTEQTIEKKKIMALLVAKSPWYDYIDYCNTQQRFLLYLTDLRQWRTFMREPR